MLYIRYWNSRVSRLSQSLQNTIKNKNLCSVPGHLGDATDRGQPGRFDRWYKLPRKAHKLYWRTH